MHLTLKRTPASNATYKQRCIARLIKWRLCSQYSHAGVVVNGMLYHVTPQRGLCVEAFDINTASAGWDFMDCGKRFDAVALALFKRLAGAQYDYFEWCARVMGLPVRRRITPEDLLIAVLQQSK